jgi:hypothetical protein
MTVLWVADTDTGEWVSPSGVRRPFETSGAGFGLDPFGTSPFGAPGGS